MHVAEMLAEPSTSSTTVALRGDLTKIEDTLTEFEKITDGLADLKARFPSDLVYDVSTTKGMAEAIAHRAAWRDPRINVEKLRKIGKAPVLALGKNIDARAAWLTEQLLAGETPIDEQIKAEEARKEAVKQAKINAEFGRVQAIQEAIAEYSMTAMWASGQPSATIAAEIERMRAVEPDPRVFQEMIEQAKAAKTSALIKLDMALKARLHEVAEAAKLAAERAELEELRRAAAAQRVKDEAAAVEARRVEDARVAAERKAAEAELAAQRAEQKRLDAEATAARAEADRAAREQREADQRRIDAERAEQLRQQVQADAERRANIAQVEAADKKLRDAAPKMLAALQAARPAVKDAKVRALIDEAIAEAV